MLASEHALDIHHSIKLPGLLAAGPRVYVPALSDINQTPPMLSFLINPSTPFQTHERPQHYNRTVTSRQGIRKWYLSKAPRSHSNPLVPFVAFAVIAEFDVPAILCLRPSIAALANEPPVPLIAETAMLAVSTSASVNVALPPMNEAVVLDMEPTKSPLQRGSNQSAEKSKREKTRTKRRI